MRISLQDDEMLKRLLPRFKSEREAAAWYRTQPIAGYGGQTAADLVSLGHAQDVLEFLDAVDAGVYA